jgi:hypothetical protein
LVHGFPFVCMLYKKFLHFISIDLTCATLLCNVYPKSSRSTSIPGTWDSSVELSQLAGLHVLSFPGSTPSISFTPNHHILGKANSTRGCCGANNPRLGICTYMSQLPLRNWILTGVQLFLLYKVLFVTDVSQVTSKL